MFLKTTVELLFIPAHRMCNKHKHRGPCQLLPPYLAELQDVDDGLADPDAECVVDRAFFTPGANRGAGRAVGRGVLAGGRRLPLRRSRVLLSGNVAV